RTFVRLLRKRADVHAARPARSRSPPPFRTVPRSENGPASSRVQRRVVGSPGELAGPSGRIKGSGGKGEAVGRAGARARVRRDRGKLVQPRLPSPAMRREKTSEAASPPKD